MPLTQSRLTQLIDVPRNVWDPTEGHHSRHGERTVAHIYGVEVHWDGSPGDLTDHFDTDDELLSFERFHEVSKGWYDLFYNAAADSEENVYEGRDITIPSQGDLYAWMTFLCVTGTDPISPEEELAFARSIFRAWTAVDPARTPSTLRYHGERSSTSCPGEQLATIVRRLRDGWIPPGAEPVTDTDHTIPDTVRDDVTYALEQGIATRDPETGDLIEPGSFVPAWRAVTFDARAHRSLSEKIDQVAASIGEGQKGDPGPRGQRGPKGDPGAAPTTGEIRAAVRAEVQYIVDQVLARIAQEITS